jgi:hypothetical protein
MTSLSATSPVDNVLLEWSLAVELHTTRGVPVLPILVGTQRTNGSMSCLFADKPPMTAADGSEVADSRAVFERVPDVIVASVVARLDDFFASRGEALSAAGRTRSAADVVTAITKLLGVTTWDLAQAHGGGDVDGLWKQWGLREAIAAKIRDAVAATDAPPEKSVERLAELLERCEIGERLADALAWCDEQRVKRASEIAEFGLVNELIQRLQLKGVDVMKLRRGLEDGGSPGPSPQRVVSPGPSDGAAQLSPQRQRTGGEVEGLASLLESCKLEYMLDAAVSWCHQQGVDSVIELKEVGGEAEFATALQLKPMKEKLLLKRIADSS